MGKGGDGGNILERRPPTNSPVQELTFDDVSKHKHREDNWLIIQGKVYDVTTFASRHPGGARILQHYAGQDATDAWMAFHPNKAVVNRYLPHLCVGRVTDASPSALDTDFRLLRQVAEDNDWFRPHTTFYMLHFLQVVLLEVVAVGVVTWWGDSWWAGLAACLALATAQSQAGWSQHDYGHLSVTSHLTSAHFLHQLTLGFIKGASARWWIYRHNQHHAKPNVRDKDPDVKLVPVFVVGDEIPLDEARKMRRRDEKARSKHQNVDGRYNPPYHWQHGYFWIFATILLPFFYHFDVIVWCYKRKHWLDLSMMAAYLIRFALLFIPVCGLWQSLMIYTGMRVLESHWFTWVTQMSHLAQPVHHDVTQGRSWVSMQCAATVNVSPGRLTDWFTGHLNYQIEHHLFPTMPRHNLHKVSPLVRSLCDKHDVTYHTKPLLTAFADIIKSLKKSGQLWYDAYYE